MDAEELVFFVSIPFIALLFLGTKIAIAIFFVELLIFGRRNKVIYSVYYNDKLKFSSGIEKEAWSFYHFLVEKYGNGGVRFETLEIK
jgi:hypothetical protein